VGAGVVRSLGPVTARRLLFFAAVALVPVPYWAVEVERAPVARLALLAGMTGVAAIAEPGGVGSVVAGALVAQSLLWLLLLALAVRLLIRWLPGARRGPAVAILVAGLLAASLFHVYHTPFARSGARANLLGIFR
jgi:hypothetical protein